MESIYDSEVCMFCKNIVDPDERTCKAFPHGIPSDIWYGKSHHTEPYPGDNGIQFMWMGGKAIKPKWMK